MALLLLFLKRQDNYMNYSVKYLNLPISQKSFFADDLCDFDRVEYLNIAHDCEFETWHGGVFKYMKSLKAFHVSNPSCKYYTEKGVLYTDDLEILYKSVDLIEDELEEFNLNDKKGKVLVAVPPAYPTDDFVIPDGVVAICSRAFDGCSFSTIQIPDTLKIIGNNVFDSLDTLKTIFVPNIKPVFLGDVNIGRQKEDISIQPRIGIELEKDIEFFWDEALGIFDFEELDFCEQDYTDAYFMPYFCRSLVFPCISMRDDLRCLKTQEGILNILDDLDVMYGEYREMMRAIILSRIDPSLLYCKDDDIARRFIHAIWGSEEYARHFLLAHVPESIKLPKVYEEDEFEIGSLPEDLDDAAEYVFYGEYCSLKSVEDQHFKEMDIYIAAHLISSSPRCIFDYLGRTFIKNKVLEPIAFDILYTEFNKKNDRYITSNLLYLKQHVGICVPLPGDFKLSAIRQQAIEMNDMLEIYSDYSELIKKYLHSDEDLKEIEESNYKELTVLSNRLLQDDLFVGSLNRFDIISMQTVVRKTMTWINENWTVVEDKASDTDCCTDDSILILDIDNPF